MIQRTWASNDKDPEDKINKLEVNNKYYPVTDNDLYFIPLEIVNFFNQSERQYREVLGFIWSKNDNKFGFSLILVISSKLRTRPILWNVTFSNWLGCFFDSLDSIWSTEYMSKGYYFINEPNSLKCIFVDRFELLNCKVKQIELLSFRGSSTDAFSASVYVKIACQHGVKISLWANKWWLAPSKLCTIPRLELMPSFLLSNWFPQSNKL